MLEGCCVYKWIVPSDHEIGFYRANERSISTICNWKFWPQRPSSIVEPTS